MKKRALLIASTKRANEDCVPFINDITQMKKFLMSKNGGSWKESEIISILNPTAQELFSLYTNTGEDFRFSYFSGHGCIINDNQYILINNCLIGTSNLTYKVKREVIIFDCCRHEYSYQKLAKNYIIKESPNLDHKTEIIYNYNSLISTLEGTIIFYTALKGKSAFATSSASYFTCFFIKILEQLKCLKIDRPLSIIAFFKLISLAMKKTGGTQTITMVSNNSCNYPFYMC